MERRRSRKVAKDQSTLTQLQAVIFPYGRHETEIIGNSSDDEMYKEVRPKKRRKTGTKSRRRDDTLTQRHGFVRSASSFECEDSDLEVDDPDQRSQETAKDRIQRMKERAEVREDENIQPENLLPQCGDLDRKANVLHKLVPQHGASNQDNPATAIAQGPTSGRSLVPKTELRTPRKIVRFATERIIPSSQTPSDAGACTQRSSHYRDADRSPLKEKSQNVCGLTPPTCERQKFDSHATCDTVHAVRSPAVHGVYAEEDGSASPAAAMFTQKSSESLHGQDRESTSDTKDSQYGIGLSYMVSSVKSSGSPESQLTSRKMLDRTRRRLTYAKAQSAAAIQPTCDEDTQPLSGKEPPVVPMGLESRGLLQRISTIQDSDDEDGGMGESEQPSNSVNTDAPPEGQDSTQYTLRNPSTYDPVNSALDRDVARFLRTQTTQTNEEFALGALMRRPRPASLLTKTTVGDSDTDADDVLIKEGETTDDEVVEIAPIPAATEPEQQSSPATRTTLRGHGESRSTTVGSDTLLGIIGAPDSQLRTQMPGICDKEEQVKHGDDEPAVDLVEKSTYRASMPQICDFAFNTAASESASMGKPSLLSVQQVPCEESLVESMKETVDEVCDMDVVLSSQPNERRTHAEGKAERVCAAIDRVPSSPPVLRSSQISTVLPTQWSQAHTSLVGMQPTWLHQSSASMSQTIPSSPIQYPWTMVHSDVAFCDQTIGQSTQFDANSGMQRRQPVVLTEFSLAPPPPEWHPGAMAMSSSPNVLTQGHGSQDAAFMPQMDG